MTAGPLVGRPRHGEHRTVSHVGSHQPTEHGERTAAHQGDDVRQHAAPLGRGHGVVPRLHGDDCVRRAPERRGEPVEEVRSGPDVGVEEHQASAPSCCGRRVQQACGLPIHPDGSGGARTTVAPNEAATAAVASVESSSTTTSSSAARSWATSGSEQVGEGVRFVSGGDDDGQRGTLTDQARQPARTTTAAASRASIQRRTGPRPAPSDVLTDRFSRFRVSETVRRDSSRSWT